MSQHPLHVEASLDKGVCFSFILTIQICCSVTVKLPRAFK